MHPTLESNKGERFGVSCHLFVTCNIRQALPVKYLLIQRNINNEDDVVFYISEGFTILGQKLPMSQSGHITVGVRFTPIPFFLY